MGGLGPDAAQLGAEPEGEGEPEGQEEGAVVEAQEAEAEGGQREGTESQAEGGQRLAEPVRVGFGVEQGPGDAPSEGQGVGWDGEGEEQAEQPVADQQGRGPGGAVVGDDQVGEQGGGESARAAAGADRATDPGRTTGSTTAVEW